MVNDSRLLKGTLSFGASGAAGGQAEAQTTNLVIEQQDGDTEDAQWVLSGDSLGGETTPGPWHITGTAIQDFDANPSLQKWSYTNRGTVQPFEFTPNDKDTSPTVTGFVSVAFLGLGGDVRVRITRDFDWGIVGEPSFGDWGTATTDEQQAAASIDPDAERPIAPLEDTPTADAAPTDDAPAETADESA